MLHSGNRRESAPVTAAVAAGALLVAALNAAAGLVGAWVWYRWDPGHPAERLVSIFWTILRVAQGAVLALAIAVGSLAAAGHYSSERLFYLYALLPIAIGFAAEQLRALSAAQVLENRGLEDARAVGRLPEGEQLEIVAAVVRREVGVMAISALVVAFLALRAAGTAHGF
jgi:hypothetical protein